MTTCVNCKFSEKTNLRIDFPPDENGPRYEIKPVLFCRAVPPSAIDGASSSFPVVMDSFWCHSGRLSIKKLIGNPLIKLLRR